MILLILYDLCLKPSTSTAVIIPTASTGLCPYPKRTSLTFNNTEGGVQGFPLSLALASLHIASVLLHPLVAGV